MRDAVARQVGEAVAAVVTLVEAAHRDIARRPLAPWPPVRVVHDTIARGVYAGVRGGLRTATAAAERAAVAPSPSPRALAILNGLVDAPYCDAALRLPMTVRAGGADVALEREAVAAAFPRAGGRVVVFVHGLFGTDEDWQRGPVAYGPVLEAELGVTPVVVRYATGRPIEANGAALAALLERLVDAWPVPVRDLTLVGHSMGGLVARSACRAGAPASTRLLVTLGTPHGGADVERALHLLGRALGVFGPSRAFGAAVDVRSPGIKDLRAGMTAEDLPGIRQAFVSAAIGGLAGTLLGDLLVRAPSAAGGSADGHHLPGRHHLALLGDPAVLAHLRDWLA